MVSGMSDVDILKVHERQRKPHRPVGNIEGPAC